MTATGTTITQGPSRRVAGRLQDAGRLLAARMGHVQARLSGLAVRGQLGPAHDTEIGRHLGARI